jgi:alternate signal-mediated exported protein
MNKLAKGAIAGAAGIILLMGGAGSLAYWSDSATAGAQGQTITAGQLKFGTPTAGAWYLNNSTTALTSTQLSQLKIVPGDKLEFKQDVPFNAQGTNLKFQATTAAGTWAAADSSSNSTDLATAIMTTAQTTATVSGTGFTNSSGTYTITTNTGQVQAGTVSISVSFTFPSTTTGSTGQTGAVKLNTSTGVVTLTQVP